MEVLNRPGDMSFLIKARVVLEAKLYCASYDSLGLYNSVCFSYDHSVYRTGCRLTGSAMVFSSFGYGFYLIFIEPFPEPSVIAYDDA